jgi:acetylglutamate kinase
MDQITLKIGGGMAAGEAGIRELARELAGLAERHRLILVHGGGAEVTSLSRTLGVEPVFREGIRITSGPEMEIVEMVLAGRINKRLVRLLQAEGLDAVGLSGSDGGLFRGESLGGEDGAATRTGVIRRVCPDLAELLLEQGYLPVLSPVCMDNEGGALNINADTAALEIAAGLKSRCLLFLSDIPGILLGERVLRSINEEEALRHIEEGNITGGMIPKVRSSLDALKRGVGRIIIGRHDGPGSLAELLEGRRGTRLTLR